MRKDRFISLIKENQKVSDKRVRSIRENRDEILLIVNISKNSWELHLLDPYYERQFISEGLRKRYDDIEEIAGAAFDFIAYDLNHGEDAVELFLKDKSEVYN